MKKSTDYQNTLVVFTERQDLVDLIRNKVTSDTEVIHVNLQPKSPPLGYHGKLRGKLTNRKGVFRTFIVTNEHHVMAYKFSGENALGRYSFGRLENQLREAGILKQKDANSAGCDWIPESLSADYPSSAPETPVKVSCKMNLTNRHTMLIKLLVELTKNGTISLVEDESDINVEITDHACFIGDVEEDQKPVLEFLKKCVSWSSSLSLLSLDKGREQQPTRSCKLTIVTDETDNICTDELVRTLEHKLQDLCQTKPVILVSHESNPGGEWYRIERVWGSRSLVWISSDGASLDKVNIDEVSEYISEKTRMAQIKVR